MGMPFRRVAGLNEDASGMTGHIFSRPVEGEPFPLCEAILHFAEEPDTFFHSRRMYLGCCVRRTPRFLDAPSSSLSTLLTKTDDVLLPSTRVLIPESVLQLPVLGLDMGDGVRSEARFPEVSDMFL